MTVPKEKLKKLEEILRSFDRVLIALSGGVDSACLTSKAVELLGRDRVLTVTVNSILQGSEETAGAAEMAEQLGVNHRVIELDLLSVPELRMNSRRRCYSCKKKIFSSLLSAAASDSRLVVLDGSNADDIKTFRPGLEALKSLGIRSPLLEAGLTKQEIRQILKEAGVQTWNKPSAACLASRFPYGVEINEKKIGKVKKAEDILKGLGINGDVRVRYHNDLARIEINTDQFDTALACKSLLVEEMKSLGFTYITLDLEGFQSGSFDR